MINKPTYEELETRIKVLDSLVLNTPGMFYNGRPDWTTEIITQSEEISGYSVEEFNTGKINWMDIIHPEDKEWVLKESAQFTVAKKTVSIEYRIIAKDGSTRWVLDKKTARYAEDNTYLGVSGIVLNITERKQIDIKLKESELKYKGVFDESIAAIYAFDKDKNFIDSNQAGLDLLGYSRNELLCMGIRDVDADPVAVLPAHKQLLSGDRIINYEHRLIRKDGKIINVLNNSRPLLDRKKNVVGMLSTLIDITERIQAQKALQKANNELEQRVQERTAKLESINKKLKLEITERKQAEASLNLFKKVVASATDAIGISSPEGRHWYQNAAFDSLFGNIGKDPPATLYCDKNIGREVFDTIMAGGEWIGEVQMYATDGRVLDILLRAYAFTDQNGQVLGLVGVHTDITARKRSEELFKLVAQSTNDIFYEWDIQTDSIHWFSDISSELGYAPGEVPPTIEAWLELIHPDDRLSLKNAVEEHRTAEHNINYDYRIKHKNGSWRYWHDHATPVLDSQKKIIRWVGGITDITERKQAEAALKESDERFTKAFHYSPFIAGISDLETGRYIEVNQAFYDKLGFTPEEVIGKSSFDVVQMDIKYRDQIVTRMKRQGSIKNEETIIYTKTGTPLNVLLSAQIIELSGKKYNYATAIDITELKRTEKAKLELQEKLNRSMKMESLGLLAGGVAHDLNNILSGIVSYPELILMDLPEDSKLRNPIESMQNAGHRAVAVVNDLLTVARGVATAKEPLNLNYLIHDYLNSSELQSLKQRHPSVTIHTKLDTGLLNISGSQIHIRKILMNLVYNAMEAIEENGNITISTFNQYIDKPLKRYDDINIGEYVVLDISDDGSGISSEDLERIFEPFYTKKVMGRSGTGLGLTVVWNAAKDHGAYIDVKNNEKGMTFQLYFPTTRDDISDKNLSIPITSYKGNGEKILVIDDEKSQRKISCKMLDVLGYKTIAVSSGEKAVEYLKEHSVDLLLLDMIMAPGINGRETYERIVRINPKQKAIIVSGFAETDDVLKAQKLGAGKYVKKPLTLERIGIAVKEELGK